MREPAFPKVIREGHTRATIDKTPYRGCDSYTVVWYEGETRKRKLFADLGDAELHARARVGQLSRGTAEVSRLEGAELLAYVRAREAVAEFGLALDTIAFEYRDAKRLVRRRSLVDVADWNEMESVPVWKVKDDEIEMCCRFCFSASRAHHPASNSSCQAMSSREYFSQLWAKPAMVARLAISVGSIPSCAARASRRFRIS
jgi:hypothetical protein